MMVLLVAIGVLAYGVELPGASFLTYVALGGLVGALDEDRVEEDEEDQREEEGEDERSRRAQRDDDGGAGLIGN